MDVISRWALARAGLKRIYGPSGIAARALPTGQMVLWLAILLAVALFLTLLDVR